MSSTFTPSDAIDMSKERDWPAALGMLDWDSTNIVFTKRTLIEFLKYTGTTVDTNFANIGKLPRYATFGKLCAPEDMTAQNATTTEADQTDGFKPSRRVRTVPGGPHTDIFGNPDEGDALSQAPPKAGGVQPNVFKPIHVDITPAVEEEQEEEEEGINFASSVKPSRRVRENPGGNSSLSNFWDPSEQKEFKPTRRVRQGPGGHDSISGLF